MNTSCFLPVKKYSTRAPGKNVRPIGEFELGLTEIKLKQLLEADCFAEIVVSSDDDRVLDLASSISNSVVKSVSREPELCADNTPLELLTIHAGEVCREDHILWTHATSPFTIGSTYRKVLDLYVKALELGHDSLVSAVPEYKFALFRGRALNYGGSDYWPKTQNLEPVLLMSSAIFLAPKTIYTFSNNRVGVNPFMYLQRGLEAFDVDGQEDWNMANALIAQGYLK